MQVYAVRAVRYICYCEGHRRSCRWIPSSIHFARLN